MTETASLHVTIPRTEEVHEKQQQFGVKGGARTLYVVQVTCKTSGGGAAQQWQLKKRYGYFERVHATATRSARAVGMPAPVLPRRKLLGHSDPRYLSRLREELQVFIGTVVDLVRRESDMNGENLSQMLLKLELPAASDSATWEQRGPRAQGGRVVSAAAARPPLAAPTLLARRPPLAAPSAGRALHLARVLG